MAVAEPQGTWDLPSPGVPCAACEAHASECIWGALERATKAKAVLQARATCFLQYVEFGIHGAFCAEREQLEATDSATCTSTASAGGKNAGTASAGNEGTDAEALVLLKRSMDDTEAAALRACEATAVMLDNQIVEIDAARNAALASVFQALCGASASSSSSPTDPTQRDFRPSEICEALDASCNRALGRSSEDESLPRVEMPDTLHHLLRRFEANSNECGRAETDGGVAESTIQGIASLSVARCAELNWNFWCMLALCSDATARLIDKSSSDCVISSTLQALRSYGILSPAEEASVLRDRDFYFEEHDNDMRRGLRDADIVMYIQLQKHCELFGPASLTPTSIQNLFRQERPSLVEVLSNARYYSALREAFPMQGSRNIAHYAARRHCTALLCKSVHRAYVADTAPSTLCAHEAGRVDRARAVQKAHASDWVRPACLQLLQCAA